MKSHELLDIIGEAQDSYLLDAKASPKRTIPVWSKWAAVAACLILILGLVIHLVSPNSDNVSLDDSGATKPSSADLQENVNPPSNTDLPGNTNPPSNNNLNYGPVNYLSVINKTDTSVSGLAFQYIQGTQAPDNRPQEELAVPILAFQHGQIHVVAKAVEELGVYETINEYGSTFTSKYRVFCMEVTNPLQSGMDGTFYYMLPADLSGDLTQYDQLLISMMQYPKNFVLHNGGKVTAFDYLFRDPRDTPELGNMIAFTDGVFDASLWETWWQDRLDSHYGYQHLKNQLNGSASLLQISEGSTLEEALQKRQQQIDRFDDWAKPKQVKHYEFQTEEAQQTMTWVKPFENGVFIPERISPDYHIRRYINGCPTNEWYVIRYETEEVSASAYRFEDEDFEDLPDISAYIANLDLTKILPQHMDTDGKELGYNTAVGWYEKTENGVYSIVRIAWNYWDQDGYVQYYDETFIILDETGDHIVSREDLIELIGDNPNIYTGEYGVGITMPLA